MHIDVLILLFLDLVKCPVMPKWEICIVIFDDFLNYILFSYKL